MTKLSILAIDGGESTVQEPIRPFTPIGQDETDAALDFLNSGLPLSGFYGSPRPEFFGGPMVLRFEEKWSETLNTRHSIAVNSATSGLIAAMGAIGLSPGDEVILPPYTMSATAVAPLFYGRCLFSLILSLIISVLIRIK